MPDDCCHFPRSLRKSIKFKRIKLSHYKYVASAEEESWCFRFRDGDGHTIVSTCVAIANTLTATISRKRWNELQNGHDDILSSINKPVKTAKHHRKLESSVWDFPRDNMYCWQAAPSADFLLPVVERAATTCDFIVIYPWVTFGMTKAFPLLSIRLYKYLYELVKVKDLDLCSCKECGRLY